MGSLDFFKNNKKTSTNPQNTPGNNLQFVPKQQFKIGQTIAGEYKVKNVFGGKGKSGMGVVYLVTACDYPYPFILKTIQLENKDELSIQRFAKEAEAWVKIGVHPNIVKALWVREIEDLLYVAAEYIPEDEYSRNNLTQFLYTTNLPSQIVLRWATQYCYGMQHALDKGLVSHRDIKPDNLMIDVQGNIKITDFGLAKLPNSINSLKASKNFQPNYNITLAGSILGTLPYMAPEQFIDSSSVDHRADIYSFGIILYQMVNKGKYPYNLQDQTQNQLEAYAQLHLNKSINPFNSLFSELIYGCLEKDPQRRINNYSEILDHLHLIGKKNQLSIPPKPNVLDVSIEELYIKAQSYMALKQPQKALESVNKYLSHAPEAYWAWTEKRRILCELKMFQDSITALEKSLSLFRANSHAWNNLGIALKNINEIDKSKKAFESALSYDSQNIGAMMNYCQVLEQLGESERVQKLLLVSLGIAPDKKVLLFNAGNHVALFIKKQKFHLALPLLTKLTRLEKDNPIHLQNLAIVYLSLGKRLNAIKSFEELIKLEPQSSFALLSLARLYAEELCFDDAIVCCEKVINSGQELIKAISLKSQFLMYKGETTSAVNYLIGVLRKYHNTDSLWFILADIQEKIGDIRGAYDSLIKCQSIVLSTEKRQDNENLKMIESRIRQLQEKMK
jgi:serine/threonine protein kinase